MKTLTKQTLLMIALSAIFSVKAQDIIIKKSGDEISAVILEVGISEIKYKKFETKDTTGTTKASPIYVISKSEVFMIKYENGTKDIFNQSKKEEIKDKIPSESIQDVCQKGKNDASLNYDASGPAGGTGIATILFSPVGLIVAIGTSSTSPSYKTLAKKAPDLKLLRSNSNYKACYKSEAHRMKKRKVWSSFGIGLAVNFAVAYLFFYIPY